MKLKIRRSVDFLMTVLLLLLMAYQVTGETLHEWIGTAMVLLFIIHNLLNIKWYGSLFKGQYKSLRAIQTVVNFALLAAMFSLAYSGVIMSRHVFAFLPIKEGMALARIMHLAASYWGFVLMSIHLGLHWGMVTGMLRNGMGRLASFDRRMAQALHRALQLLGVFAAGYGAYCFLQADILSSMFLKVEFAFLDYDKSGIIIILENTAMMGLWIFIGYYLMKVIALWQHGWRNPCKQNRIIKDR